MMILAFVQQNLSLITQSLLRHMLLVFLSVGMGMLVAIPTGILLSRKRMWAGPVLTLAGTIQTIPGLVMLGLALLILGIGMPPALAVLGLYAILPILRNTYTGIVEVNPQLVEAARGIGMTNAGILFHVELPLALPVIMSGIRISTVYIISWATLAGLIGAGGLGDLIWTGLSTYNTQYILAGAIPSAILALIASSLLGRLTRWLTPRGLREVKP